MKSLLTLSIILFTRLAFATIWQSDGSPTSIQSIHDNQAVNGDTIRLPIGTFHWTGKVTITKSIIIKGFTLTNSTTGACSDKTILIDDLVHIPGDQPFFDCTTPLGRKLEITGITFSGPGNRGDTMYNGAVKFSGGSTGVRIDHCHFTGGLLHNNYIAVYGTIYGVADHIVFDNMPSQIGQNRVFNGTGWGDKEFDVPAGYGGPKFWFFEDNYVNNTAGPFTGSGGVDAAYGGKFVVRHCHLYDVEILCHGTEADRGRGGRAQEIYSNDYHWTYQTTLDGIRSGSLLVHDNTYDGMTPNGYSLQTYRTFWNYNGFFGAASGDNAWDYDSTEPDGSHIDGHPPYLFASGTVTIGTSTTLTDTSRNWTVNQWIGYTAKRLSDSVVGKIISNTSNTLTFVDSGYSKPDWASGNQYQIHKVLIALDQPCRGAGDLLVGDTPPPAWPHQVIEPCYSWNNIHSPGNEHINFVPGYNATLALGIDYFNDTPMPGYTSYTYPHPMVTP